ncbi:MAG: DUF2188 domain-containing protein [Candidatus Saccharimonadales bacterium]
MAANRRDVHVVPNKSSGQLDWSVKREGAQRSSGTYANKADALAAARQIAVNNGLEMFEHGKNGQIQNRNTYGKHDPYPPKG